MTYAAGLVYALWREIVLRDSAPPSRMCEESQGCTSALSQISWAASLVHSINEDLTELKDFGTAAVEKP